MKPSGTFIDFLGEISLKAVLKKILLEIFIEITKTTDASADQKILAGRGFPLGGVISSAERFGYPSAIATRLAAQKSQNAILLAHYLAELFQNYFCHSANELEATERAIAQNLQVTANDRGWLTMTLADQGIIAWLNLLKSVELPAPAHQDWQYSLSRLQKHHFPLCDRLKLSLPALLGWADARCGTLITQAKQTKGANCHPPEPPLALSANRNCHWTSQAPPACHDLLKAVIQAIDGWADKSGTGAAALQQGYAVAAAVYAFDAAMPIATVKTRSPLIQATIWSTLEVAQKCLALIAMSTFGQRLSPYF